MLPLGQLQQHLQACVGACEQLDATSAPVKLRSAATALSQKRGALHKELVKASGPEQLLSLPHWVRTCMHPRPLTMIDNVNIVNCVKLSI